jgi:uncharacterized protein (TIGR02284 family)
MSTDKRVTLDLIETLRDGEKGFGLAADRLADSDRPELSSTMRAYSDQRAAFAAELETLAAQYGDDVDDDGGSLGAALHRGWMTLKDAVTGSSAEAVLDVAEQGEDHAVSEFEDALSKDISAELRNVVQRQLTDIKLAHDDVKSLRNAVS